MPCIPQVIRSVNPDRRFNFAIRHGRHHTRHLQNAHDLSKAELASNYRKIVRRRAA